MLTLLEREITGGRERVRRHLPEILKPNLRKRDALETHRALFTLAHDTTDEIRLVTTNFDRLFVKAIRQCTSQTVVNRKEALNDYLKHRVRRIFPAFWPNGTAKRSIDESQAIALFCVRTSDQFPLWVSESRPFLSRFRTVYPVLTELVDNELCRRFPSPALDFLDRVVANNPYETDALNSCLDQLVAAAPRLKGQSRFRRLRDMQHKK